MEEEAPFPTARGLSDMRFITSAELIAAREALLDALDEGELTEGGIEAVFAVLLEGGPSAAGDG